MALSEWHLLIVLAATLTVNFVLSLFSGFRDEYSPIEAISESLTAVGIGIIFSAFVLWLIGELDKDISAAEIAGKVLLEAAIVNLGVSFANVQIRNKTRAGEEKQQHTSKDQQNDSKPAEDAEEEAPDLERLQLREDLRDVSATLAGSTVFALNVAPTEEILMIATRLSPGNNWPYWERRASCAISSCSHQDLIRGKCMLIVSFSTRWRKRP